MAASKPGGSLPLKPPFEFGALGGVGGGQPFAPRLVRADARLSRLPPSGQDVVGNDEGRGRPVQVFAGARDLFLAGRFAMRFRRTGTGRQSEAYRCLAGDEARLVGNLRPADRGEDRRLVVAVDIFGAPTIGFEALHLIVGIGERDRPVDRNSIIVVEDDQFVEPQIAGDRAGFVRDALHQIAIGCDYIGAMVDERVAELGV